MFFYVKNMIGETWNGSLKRIITEVFQCVRISWVMPSRSPKDREGRRVESSDPLCNWTQFLFFFPIHCSTAMELFGPAGLRRSCRCVSQRTAWSRSSRPTPDAHNVDADAHSDRQPQPHKAPPRVPGLHSQTCQGQMAGQWAQKRKRRKPEWNCFQEPQFFGNELVNWASIAIYCSSLHVGMGYESKETPRGTHSHASSTLLELPPPKHLRVCSNVVRQAQAEFIHVH